MSQENGSTGDPLAMLRKMWGSMGLSLPGMVIPTFDSEELEKRIADLKAVEGWLSMNLSMLQMTIRSLEMQNTTIRTVRAMGEMASNAAEKATQAAEGSQATPPAEDAEAKVWPWMMMQQVQEYMQRQSDATAKEEPTADSKDAESGKGRKKAGK